MKHELKIWPQFFEAVVCGDKTFEYRVNDRAFQKGDQVVLCEWDKTEYVYDSNLLGEDRRERGYTGRKAEFAIGYVLPVSETHVVFSLVKPTPGGAKPMGEE